MKRVLIDATELCARATGVARYERELLARLTPMVDATVLVRRKAVEDGSAGTLTGRIVSLPDRLPSAVIEQLVVPAVTMLTRPEIVHTLAGAQAMIAPRTKRVLTYHEDRRAYFSRFPPAGTYMWLASRWHVWTAERSARSADVVLTVSESAALELAATGMTDQSRILAVQHGVSDQFCVDDTFERDSFVLMLASDDPRDNPSMVIEAMSALGTDAQLVVAGRVSSSARQRIEESIRRWSVNLRFTGEVSDQELAALYRTCMCFVHASDYEGFGLAVLEALASGAVVIARPSRALEEVAGSVALTGRTAAELGARIREISSDPNWRSDLGRAGVERSRMFNWDRAAQLTLGAYAS